MNTGQERNKEEMREGFREWKGEEVRKKATLTSVLVTTVCLQLTSAQMNLVTINHVSITFVSCQEFIVHQIPCEPPPG